MVIKFIGLSAASVFRSRIMDRTSVPASLFVFLAKFDTECYFFVCSLASIYSALWEREVRATAVGSLSKCTARVCVGGSARR